jgi:hypothetical protein
MKRTSSVPFPETEKQKITIKPEIEQLNNQDEISQIVRPEMPIIQPQKKPL